MDERDISEYLTGSAMPKLTQGNMNRIPLLTPPLIEQRAIAHILGTLDDKIELNRRKNSDDGYNKLARTFAAQVESSSLGIAAVHADKAIVSMSSPEQGMRGRSFCRNLRTRYFTIRRSLP
jgi:Type I restriction modification DNA specificity domain